MSKDHAGDISPREAWLQLEGDPQAQLIDVRTDAEWAFVGRPELSALGKQAHFLSWQFFPGGRLNDAFAAQIEQAGLQRDQALLFICRSGQRSLQAARALAALGYDKCYNVAEGFEGDKDAQGHRGVIGGWKAAGLPWRQD